MKYPRGLHTAKQLPAGGTGDSGDRATSPGSGLVSVYTTCRRKGKRIRGKGKREKRKGEKGKRGKGKREKGEKGKRGGNSGKRRSPWNIWTCGYMHASTHKCIHTLRGIAARGVAGGEGREPKLCPAKGKAKGGTDRLRAASTAAMASLATRDALSASASMGAWGTAVAVAVEVAVEAWGTSSEGQVLHASSESLWVTKRQSNVKKQNLRHG